MLPREPLLVTLSEIRLAQEKNVNTGIFHIHRLIPKRIGPNPVIRVGGTAGNCIWSPPLPWYGFHWRLS